jgi:hypothetical protein
LALEVTQDACAYRGEQAAELCLGRGLGGMKRELAVRSLREHTIEHDHVTVQVEIGGRSKALQKGDTTAAAVMNTSLASALSVEAHERADEDRNRSGP